MKAATSTPRTRARPGHWSQLAAAPTTSALSELLQRAYRDFNKGLCHQFVAATTTAKTPP
eukprot:COSAG06_NODE_668_length_13234_cov_75.848268_4_plen_60_part_00